MCAQTLQQYPSSAQSQQKIDSELADALFLISEACQNNSTAINQGSQTNIQGEMQKQLDVISNNILIESIGNSHIVSMVSEEMVKPYPLAENMSKPGIKYLLVCDPLDGSSNVDINVSVESIFFPSALPHRTSLPNGFFCKLAGSSAAQAMHSKASPPCWC
jgi:fructose-1,6-bisphosphatase I